MSADKKVRKLSMAELHKIIKEEVGKLGPVKDVEDAKADEVDADEYAETLEKKLDMQKALKIKEQKALLYLESLRRQQMALEETLNELGAYSSSYGRKYAQARAGKKLAQARAKAVTASKDKEKEKEEPKQETEMKALKRTQAQNRLRKARANARDKSREDAEWEEKIKKAKE